MNKYLIMPVIALVCGVNLNAAEGWETDFKAASDRAAKENKKLLLEFTGSDWCPPCMQMKKNVFSKKEFLDEAQKDFVLVELDYPQSKEQSDELKKQNADLAKKYQVNAYPTVVFANADGSEIKRFVGGRDLKRVQAAMKSALDPNAPDPEAEDNARMEKLQKETAGFEGKIEEVMNREGLNDQQKMEEVAAVHREFLKKDGLSPYTKQMLTASLARVSVFNNKIDEALKLLDEAKDMDPAGKEDIETFARMLRDNPQVLKDQHEQAKKEIEKEMEELKQQSAE